MIYKDTPDYLGRFMTGRERDIQESFERVVMDLGFTPYEHGYLTAYRKVGDLTYEVEKFVDEGRVNYEVIVYRRGGDEVYFKSGFTTIDAAISHMYKAVPFPTEKGETTVEFETDPTTPLDEWDMWGRDDFMTYIDDAGADDGDDDFCFEDYQLADKLADLIESQSDLMRFEYTSDDKGYWPALEKAGHKAYEILKQFKGE